MSHKPNLAAAKTLRAQQRSAVGLYKALRPD